MVGIVLGFGAVAQASEAEASLRRWLPSFEKAVQTSDTAFLEPVFHEITSLASSDAVRDAMQQRFAKGIGDRRAIDCRAELCRVTWPDSGLVVTLYRTSVGWSVWNDAYTDHVQGATSATLQVRGPGRVDVRINESPTFYFGSVHEDDVAEPSLDRALRPGTNTITLVPTGQVTAKFTVAVRSQGVKRAKKEVRFDGPLVAPETFTLVREAGTRPVPHAR